MDRDHLLSNGTYDALTAFVTLLLPGIAAFYTVMYLLLDWPHAMAVVGTCAVFAFLFGIVLRASKVTWKTSETKFDGQVAIMGYDSDTGRENLQITFNKEPREFFAKRTIRLKPIDMTNTSDV